MIGPSKARLFSPRSLAFGMPGGSSGCDNATDPRAHLRSNTSVS
jgi:hypothetical protein